MQALNANMLAVLIVHRVANNLFVSLLVSSAVLCDAIVFSAEWNSPNWLSPLCPPPSDVCY